MTSFVQTTDTRVLDAIAQVERLNQNLLDHFGAQIEIYPAFSRQLVSFQISKSRPIDRWYKYKEAYSADLVTFFLRKYGVEEGPVLDPFAGVGTTLFAASELGLAVDGIELLPIGQEVIRSRLTLTRAFNAADFAILKEWIAQKPWMSEAATSSPIDLPELRITHGAYPEETAAAIRRYLGCLQNEQEPIHEVLRFALLCVLESVSYTRKDGQYLRWDFRSGRRQGARPFNKGAILSFNQAITAKLQEIVDDCHHLNRTLPLFELDPGRHTETPGTITLHSGSCFNQLPRFPRDHFTAIVTSPPYCNRYDYTRTYALELALLGTDESGINTLRQQMLSCTVENRAKDLTAINPGWRTAIEIADRQGLLQAILRYLELQNTEGKLNNKGIPRMIRGYFYEMACIIAECARVLTPGAPLIMVNDNVRYAGVSISVDLILSDMASKLGFEVEQIIVLPSQKGNSSQQMGAHGRDALRKCIYVWRKAP